MFDQLDDGDWVVHVTADGCMQADVPVRVDAHTADLNIVLGPPARVRGIVLDDAGRPVVGASVCGAEEPTDGAGRFVAETPLESTRFDARKQGHAPSVAVEVAAGPGETVEGIVLRLRPACILRGVVVAPDGAPLEGAGVDVLFDDEESSSDVDTDATGAFSFELPPGPARVLCDGDEAWVELAPGSPTFVTLVKLVTPVTLRAELVE